MNRGKWPKDKSALMATMWASGMLVKDIADAFDVKRSTITSHARYLKLKPRRVDAWGKPKGPPLHPTPWELRPLPPEPPVVHMDSDEQRYVIWKRQRDGAAATRRALETT